MLFSLFIEFAKQVMLFIISLLPTANPEDFAYFVNVQYVIDDVKGVIAWANFFFPVDMLWRMLIVTAGWSVAMIGLRLVIRVVTLVRGR